jgi:hypothetical protein
MYQSTKPYKSSEVGSVIITHFVEWPVLQVKAIMELLEVCLRTYIWRFFQQKDGMAMESSVTHC